LDKEQLSDIVDAIANRSTWENDLRRWYTARHRGPGRQRKPYPGAPDLHFPLCDSLIQRTKPFYVQQLYMSENIASFRPLFEQQMEETEQLQAWYDYQLKQHSNFEEEIYSGIDQMLVSGRAVVGLYWDEDDKRLGFYNINPLYFVVPDQVDDLDRDAVWCLHIENITVAQYKANKLYNQKEEFVKKITGAEGADASQRSNYETKKAYREGLTYAQKDRILVWHLYTREGSSILAETVSPALPPDGDPIRESFSLPYDKGCFKKGAYPFFSLRYEVKDKGWNAPRGVIEQALPYENSLSATWNAKHEWMDFACRPVFETTQPMANSGNIKMAPGDTLPFGIKMNEAPPAPIDFSAEMQSIRATAEYLVQIPDVGGSAHLSGKEGYGGEKATATQIQAIVGQSNQSNDLHGRIFKMDMGKGLDKAWAILTQYANQNLQYFVGKTSSKINPQVLDGNYEIELNVSADSWNKEAQTQRAAAMLQMFGNSPYADAGVITKTAMDGFSPGLSRDAYRDPGTKQQDETERQNEELVLILNNFSASVKPFDDDKSHLLAIDQFIPVRMQEVQSGQEKPPTPQQAQALSQHIQGHLQALSTKKDPLAEKEVQNFAPILQMLDQVSQSPQGAAGANDVAQSPSAPMANGAAEGAPAQNQDKPSAVANALANLMKSGASVSVDEVNAALVNMGLPPLAQGVAPTTQALNATKAVAEAIAPPQKNVQAPKAPKAS
jgi:hypothetical protein